MPETSAFSGSMVTLLFVFAVQNFRQKTCTYRYMCKTDQVCKKEEGGAGRGWREREREREREADNHKKTKWEGDEKKAGVGWGEYKMKTSDGNL